MVFIFQMHKWKVGVVNNLQLSIDMYEYQTKKSLIWNIKEKVINIFVVWFLGYKGKDWPFLPHQRHPRVTNHSVHIAAFHTLFCSLHAGLATDVIKREEDVMSLCDFRGQTNLDLFVAVGGSDVMYDWTCSYRGEDTAPWLAVYAL